MEDDFNIGEIPKIDIPNIEVPITHETPKTTIESLTQIKNEFTHKLQEAVAKNDSSKKRRYERQIKQFDDAIKATKEGKVFNYNELPMPPGFAKIPLTADGKAILGGSSSSTTTNRASTQPTNRSSQLPVAAASKHDNEDEVSDDLLAALENEADGFEDDDGEGHDPEMDHINRQINSLMPGIKKAIPKEHKMDDDIDMDFDEDITTLMESKGRGGVNRDSKAGSSSRFPSIIPPVVAPVPAKQPAKKPANKELAMILERQRLFKEAALDAKKEGNTNVALVYLRHAKGFESMIMAAENGLPLDMNNLPVPPQLGSGKSPKSSEKGASQASAASSRQIEPVDVTIPGDRNSVYRRLEENLTEQIRIAMRYQKNYQHLGDVVNAKRFEKIARESLQDLDSLKSGFEHGEPIPLYHYEKRSYQMIDSNPDLTDNDLELTVIRAINLPLPKDFEAKHMTTYVKFEFPYPPEAVQTDKTAKQSGTLNPEYNQTFKIQIQRKQQKFVRLMNRKDLKLEIYYKAGLLKGDKLLASCPVKLQVLENSSTIHDAFDLLEGRRQIGGKLEVKIRIREPLLHKQVQTSEHKWLIIDSFSTSSKTKKIASF